MNAQLPELVRLRWRMIRAERVRLGLLLLAGLIPGALTAAVVAGQLMPTTRAFDVTLLAPTALLGFAAICVVAPLATGGGNELFPADQLVAYPVRPGTEFLASLAVTPLNLAWMSQFVLLFGVTSYIVGGRPGLGPALVTTLCFAALATVSGQAITWLLLGVRRTPRGRRFTWALAFSVVAALVAIVRSGAGFTVLDHAPTRPVVSTILRGARLEYAGWVSGTLELALATAVMVIVGMRVCAWSLRRPGDGGVLREARHVRPRSPRRGGPLRELLAVDRASVWRSAPLRRGIVVLAVLPGLVAAGAGLRWDSVVLVPGLVAAGAGLLFGVNVFCLDAQGAVWLASLPHRPRLAMVSKALVITETCLGACLVAVVAAGLRSPSWPSLTEFTAVAGCVVTCTATVLATCLHLSLTRPRRADLRDARDTPAPPAAMAVYSARLALATTLTCVGFAAAVRTGHWQVPLLLAVPLTARALASVATSLRRWDDEQVRAQVVAAVAAG